MTKAPLQQLFDALSDGDVLRVRDLLGREVSVLSARGEGERTALMVAASCSEKRLELIQALLAAGADAKAVDHDGASALHWAIDRNVASDPTETAAVLRALVDAGAPLEGRGAWGWTPLMRAVVSGDAVEVGALLKLGAKVEVDFPADTRPEFLRGLTLLGAAVGEPDKVEALLAAGADRVRKDANGHSAVEVARVAMAEPKASGKTSRVYRAALIRSIALLESS